MTKYAEQIGTGLSLILQQCTAAQTVLSSCSEEERERFYCRERQRSAEFMERLQEESLNGRNEALRSIAGVELELFHMMSQDTIPDIVPLLQSEGMDSKEAKEEAVLLCLEYLLDTAFQSLRSAFLISYETVMDGYTNELAVKTGLMNVPSHAVEELTGRKAKSAAEVAPLYKAMWAADVDNRLKIK